MLTLRAELSADAEVVVPAGVTVRRSTAEDRDALGRLYFESYDPGVACDTLAEAIEDIDASFSGAYGDYWFAASPVVVVDGEIVAAIMVVRRASWADTPNCPFVIEVFTDRSHRRRGLARCLLGVAMHAVIDAGETHIALRVAGGNDAALRLYASLGFEELNP